MNYENAVKSLQSLNSISWQVYEELQAITMLRYVAKRSR